MVQTSGVLHHRSHLTHLGRLPPPDPRVLHYIRCAGFYCIYRLRSNFHIDDALITALVERWRQETHTFHLTVEEATVTLQDVAVLLGLRVDVAAVTGSVAQDWPALAQHLLGVVVPDEDGDGPRRLIRGSSINTKWLRERFSVLPNDVNDHTIQCYARAYILLLMHCVLFADASGSMVQMLYLPLLANLEKAGQYSWGSATLAYLYRQLCKAAKKEKNENYGPVILLQVINLLLRYSLFNMSFP